MNNSNIFKLVNNWNDTFRKYPQDICLHTMFEQQVARTPDATALLFQDKILTYRELDRRAACVSSVLQQHGVGPDVIVGICIERSIEMVIGLLAILKAGGAYLPLDPEYPKMRMSFVIGDAEIRHVLTSQQCRRLVDWSEAWLLNLDDEELYRQKSSKVAAYTAPENLAYVIYTSGSTGQPKGVMIEHKAIVNRIIWMQDQFRITAADRVLQKTSYSFDVSVWEFFWPLTMGAQLVIAKPGGQKDAGYLLEIIHTYRVTIAHFVPSMLRLFLSAEKIEQAQNLRLVVCSGEALLPDLEKLFFARVGASLFNLYGPTEAAVDVSYWECQRASTLSTVPIGLPIANIQLYILDDRLNLVDVGKEGELYIGGIGLARGYLNRPELTSERFIVTPVDGSKGTRLYKTGDICRYMPDGNIVYLGRADFQVKIRGFRVELGEIESIIIKEAAVKDCVVIAREDVPGDIRLIAYVVTDAMEFSAGRLLEILQKKLPEYMLPSACVRMDQLPLSSNGKIDRKALPKPGKKRPDLRNDYRRAKTELEKKFEVVWCRVLGLDAVGMHDNFYDLGGNSFLAVQVVNNLKDAYNIVLPVVKMFALPTIDALIADYEKKDITRTVALVDGVVEDAAKDSDDVEDESMQNAIAIIGMSGRFPGAPDIQTFWENLCNGIESVTHFTREELLDAGVAPALLDNPNYVKSAPIIADADCFDASFFGFNAEDARTMDPQHRIFLECCWSSVEDAGYNPDEYEGKIGVFGGCSINFYYLKNVLVKKGWEKPLESFIAMIGNEKDYLTTKVSYNLNLTGPSVNLQTGCSTALVAVHLACQSLLNYDCDMALAGASTVRVPQKEGYIYTEGLIASKDGHCRTFDENASGSLFGEGVGVVLLKRYQDAVKDGDTIDAVILGTAINNDGSLKVGYTAPSVKGQADVIKSAYAMANVESRDISYIETHGTGTLLGDPIEVRALTEVFGMGDVKHCVLGSVKPNIGHLDAAAGIAGLIKTVLVLKNRRVPPVINLTKVNPRLELEKTPFFINTECIDLVPPPQQGDRSRLRAGVSSFGVGGTNAHAVLQAVSEAEPGVPDRGIFILPCSAKSQSALIGNMQKMATALRANNSVAMQDLAFTLQKGRKHFSYRGIVVADTVQDAGVQFRHLSENCTPKKVLSNPIVTFMFTGQGSQYVNMGRALYDQEPLFKKSFDECVSIISAVKGVDFLSLMFSSGEPTSAMSELLKRTDNAQPALFTLEYSLAQLLLAWGIKPARLIGHSSGEYVAAALAGVFSLQQAIEIICMRGELMQSMPEGMMLAVSLPAEEASKYCNKDVSLAVVNSPGHSVLAGTNTAIQSLRDELKARNVQTTTLKTSHAFHSVMMEPVAEAFVKKLETMKFKEPAIPFVSNVTGEYITNEDAVSPVYWGKHIRGTVLFSEGVQKLLLDKEQVMVEVGPGSTLCSLVKMQEIDSDSVYVTSSLPAVQAADTSYNYFLRSVGQMWSRGVAIRWDSVADVGGSRRVHLPTYSFDTTRYWIDVDTAPRELMKKGLKHHIPHSTGKGKKEAAQKREDIDVTQTVIMMWKDLLGVDTVSSKSNYFDLGGTSLQALRLFEQVEKKFGAYLSVGSLINAPTVEELVQLIEQKEYHETNWSLVVPIRSTGTKKPLFLIHGGGGNILLYRELAMCLPEHQPVYGIQAQGLNGKDPILTTIEEMAGRYVKEILKVDADGPYYLGGYCLGGTIVYEMAQQLSAAGKQVALVAMFDTYREWFELTRADRRRFLIDNIGFHIKNIAQASMKGKVDFIRERGFEALRRINRKIAVASSQVLYKAGVRTEPPLIIMETVNDTAARNYVAKPYRGKITVFKSKAFSGIVDPYLGWRSVETGGIDLINLSAYRNGILISPFVKELASEVAKRLER